jgi:hypothetical protein
MMNNGIINSCKCVCGFILLNENVGIDHCKVNREDYFTAVISCNHCGALYEASDFGELYDHEALSLIVEHNPELTHENNA